MKLVQAKMMYYFYLFGIPAILLLILLLVIRKRKLYLWAYCVQIMIFHSVLMMAYSVVLGIITHATFLEDEFKGHSALPSLIISGYYSQILPYAILPMSVIYIFIRLGRYDRK